MLDRWTNRVPALNGELTTLREVAASDIYPLFTLFSDPEVTAYMAPPPPTLAKFVDEVKNRPWRSVNSELVHIYHVPHDVVQKLHIDARRMLLTGYKVAGRPM